MRYQSLSSFQKHLKDAAPNHLCSVYLVLMADDFERLKTLDRISSYVQANPERFSASDCNFDVAVDSMGIPSLLGQSVVILDEVEKLKKAQQEKLIPVIRAPAGYIFLGARSKLSSLASIVESQGIVLDLTAEKPWDREKRLSNSLIQRAQESKKTMSPDVVQLIFDRVGTDPALTFSEVEKLISFVGDRSVITAQDVLENGTMSHKATLWQSAEKMVWEKGECPSLDTMAFHAIVPALRNQLHLGLTLAILIEKKVDAGQWKIFLPKLFPKTLEKRSSQAARFGSAYFKKGLATLFDIELASRTHSTQYQALLQLFQAKLYG